MSVVDGSDTIVLDDNRTYNGDRIAAGTAWEVLTQIELDLAYSSEKVSNLELLVMEVVDKASDYEVLGGGSEELLTESVEKAFQFDILSGFLNSELKVIESFMSSLQSVIIDARKKFTESDENLEESLPKIEVKLHQAEESLRNSQEQVAYIRKQSEKFEKLLAVGISTEEDLENVNCSLLNSEWNLHSVEQQRHFLQSLEKSLAREMDLENKLFESINHGKELKMKLQFAEQDAYCSEDLIDVLLERMLEAENTVELLLGKSKEFMRNLQTGQFSSSTSTAQEWEEKANMEGTMVKLFAEEPDPDDSRTISIGSDVSPVFSEVDIKTSAKEVQANDGIEKADLERKLKELYVQLEHAKASVEANEEQKNMLYTTLNDMEYLIEDLKGKVSKAENRAEIAEAKYALLTDTNLEMNEELSFLRGRLESLEALLHQADMTKVATAKDIANRTRFIFELVKKLALERVHLQLQMSALTKRNKILTKKCLLSENVISENREKAKNNNDRGNINSYDETIAESSLSTSFQVEEAPIRSGVLEMMVDPVLEEESMPNIEVVRTIEATQLNWKYIFMAFIFLLASVIAVFFLST